MNFTLETTTRILICFNTNLFDWETKHFVEWHDMAKHGSVQTNVYILNMGMNQ